MSKPEDKTPPPSAEFESEPSSAGFGTGQTTGGFTLPPRHIGQPLGARYRITAPGLPVERSDPPRPVARPPRPDLEVQKAPSLELGRPRRPSVIVPPIERPSPYGRWIRQFLTVVVAFAIAAWALNRFRRVVRDNQLQPPAASTTQAPSGTGP